MTIHSKLVMCISTTVHTNSLGDGGSIFGYTALFVCTHVAWNTSHGSGSSEKSFRFRYELLGIEGWKGLVGGYTVLVGHKNMAAQLLLGCHLRW